MTLDELIKELIALKENFSPNTKTNVKTVKRSYLGDSDWGITIELSSKELKRNGHRGYMGS